MLYFIFVDIRDAIYIWSHPYFMLLTKFCSDNHIYNFRKLSILVYKLLFTVHVMGGIYLQQAYEGF